VHFDGGLRSDSWDAVLCVYANACDDGDDDEGGGDGDLKPSRAAQRHDARRRMRMRVKMFYMFTRASVMTPCAKWCVTNRSNLSRPIRLRA